MRLNTLGSDPEFGLVSSLGKAVPVSMGISHADLPNLGGHGQCVFDGVAIELNPAPATNITSFISNTLSCGDAVSRYLSREGNLFLAGTDHLTYDMSDLELVGGPAMISGCVPDYCAWDRKRRPRFQFQGGLRMFGGHIHVGCEELVGDRDSVIKLVKMLDLLIKVPEVEASAPSPRSDFYGAAGIFLPTMYGVEYRSPSNHWARSRSRCEQVYVGVQQALGYMEDADNILSEYGEEIQRVINTHDRQGAERLMNTFSFMVRYY